MTHDDEIDGLLRAAMTDLVDRLETQPLSVEYGLDTVTQAAANRSRA